MNVNVQLFSFLRDCLPEGTKRGRITVELVEGASLIQLLERLNLNRCLGGEIDPEKFTASWQVSVNGEFVLDLNKSLVDGDQVLVFPHIAGGQ